MNNNKPMCSTCPITRWWQWTHSIAMQCLQSTRLPWLLNIYRIVLVVKSSAIIVSLSLFLLLEHPRFLEISHYTCKDCILCRFLSNRLLNGARECVFLRKNEGILFTFIRNSLISVAHAACVCFNWFNLCTLDHPKCTIHVLFIFNINKNHFIKRFSHV